MLEVALAIDSSVTATYDPVCHGTSAENGQFHLDVLRNLRLAGL